MEAVLPENEAQRLHALRRYKILDTPPEPAFDQIAKMAANFFRVPMAGISLVDAGRVWFKSRIGINVEQVARDAGLCQSAMLSDGVYHVRDAAQDERALGRSFVAAQGIRFYAAAPLRSRDGFNLGTVWVLDQKPRDLAPGEAEMLLGLAALTMNQIELRRYGDEVARLEHIHRTITEGVEAEVGDRFFSTLARSLAQALEVAYAFVSRLSDDGKHFQILALWERDHFGNKLEFPLRGTPCESVLHGEVAYYVDNLQPLFPEDRLLVTWNAQSYCGVPVLDGQGRIFGHIAILDDKPMLDGPLGIGVMKVFAERVRAEVERLRFEGALREANVRLGKSEEQFRDLFEEAPIAYVHQAADTRILRANSAALRILGVEHGEIEGMIGNSFVADTPEAQRRLRDALPLMASGTDIDGLVLELRRKDGRPLWVRWWARPRAEGDYFRSMFIDITDQVTMERENVRLAESEKEYRTILDAIPQLISALTPDGRHIYANQALLDYTGLTREEQERRDWLAEADFGTRIFHPEDLERVREERSHGFSTGIPFQNEQRARRHDGKYRWFLIHYRPVRDKNGQLVRWYATGTDIDDQKQAELRLQAENAYLLDEIRSERNFGDIIGASSGLRKVMHQVKLVAPTDATVLITGESGTGKELVARGIHEQSARRERPLVKLNCSAVPEGLFESEFFGHVKGAFTGALKDKPGRFELADGGTLFLDEIGEVPLAMQSKLLRVLQEQELERVGDTHTRKVNVRVIAATNRDLKKEVDEGRFRQDLFYRLSVFPIEMPPLRQRREDIAPLVAHFVRQSARRMNRPEPQISKVALEQLSIYQWPGNVRELQNMIERAVILWRDGPLTFDLPDSLPLGTSGAAATPVANAAVLTRDELKRQERDALIKALKQTNGKVSGPGGAAELLGMKPTTLSSRISSLGIDRRTLS
jgi:PAS domain S-box-containing protein